MHTWILSNYPNLRLLDPDHCVKVNQPKILPGTCDLQYPRLGYRKSKPLIMMTKNVDLQKCKRKDRHS